MDTKNNRMSLWSYVSYVKSKTKKPGDESCLENRDGGLIHDNLSKSKILNEYFSSVFVREDDDNFYGKNFINEVQPNLMAIKFTQGLSLKLLKSLMWQKQQARMVSMLKL